MTWIRTARCRETWLVILAATAVLASSAASAGVVELPRYRLEPGMVLSYEGRAFLKDGNETYLEEQDTTAYIIRRNPDGSCRVIIRIGNRFREVDKPGAITAPTKKREAPPMDYSLGSFDLFPDGRLGSDAEVGPDIDPAMCFPRLPDDAARGEWGHRDARTGQEYGYASLRREPDGWAFHAERLGPWQKVYGMSFGSTYHFDRGMVAGAEQEFSLEAGAKGKGSGKVELKGVEQKDAAWVAAFAPAADRFIAAIHAYRKSTRAAAQDVENCHSLMMEAKERLLAARAATDQSILRAEFDRTLAGHDPRAKSCAESAKRSAAVVGKPSFDWSLQGLDGKAHALADYRGKVVVLDFWYRGCGWCVKAMPTMNALAGRFEGRPVAVLGMNTDAKEEDARFVADVMGLKYETLRAQGMPEKYNIRGFPTVVLIGPDGVVRDIHAGYSPTMGTDLAAAIEGMLAPRAEPTPKP